MRLLRTVGWCVPSVILKNYEPRFQHLLYISFLLSVRMYKIERFYNAEDLAQIIHMLFSLSEMFCIQAVNMQPLCAVTKVTQ